MLTLTSVAEKLSETELSVICYICVCLQWDYASLNQLHLYGAWNQTLWVSQHGVTSHHSTTQHRTGQLHSDSTFLTIYIYIDKFVTLRGNVVRASTIKPLVTGTQSRIYSCRISSMNWKLCATALSIYSSRRTHLLIKYIFVAAFANRNVVWVSYVFKPKFSSLSRWQIHSSRWERNPHWSKTDLTLLHRKLSLSLLLHISLLNWPQDRVRVMANAEVAPSRPIAHLQ